MRRYIEAMTSRPTPPPWPQAATGQARPCLTRAAMRGPRPARPLARAQAGGRCIVCRGWCDGGLCRHCDARFAFARERCDGCGLPLSPSRPPAAGGGRGALRALPARAAAMVARGGRRRLRLPWDRRSPTSSSTSGSSPSVRCCGRLLARLARRARQRRARGGRAAGARTPARARLQPVLGARAPARPRAGARGPRRRAVPRARHRPPAGPASRRARRQPAGRVRRHAAPRRVGARRAHRAGGRRAHHRRDRARGHPHPARRGCARRAGVGRSRAAASLQRRAIDAATIAPCSASSSSTPRSRPTPAT